MEASPSFGAPQLFVSDVRLALAVLNHVRYQALAKAFGMSREQANVLTAVLLLTAADGVYEAGRWVGHLRPPHVSGGDAALGALAVRDAALGVAGPANRAVPGFETLLALAVVGGISLPVLRRAAHGLRVAEERLRATELRVRRERIRRYVAAVARRRTAGAQGGAAPGAPAA